MLPASFLLMPPWFAALDLLIAIAFLAVWYFYFLRYNRKKAKNILQWIGAVSAGHASVLSVRWDTRSRFQVKLQFRSHGFHNGRMAVQLLPREIPLKWLLSRYHGQQETLTFEADLDCAPAFSLEVHNYRWKNKPSRKTAFQPGRLQLVRTGPVVLTTRGDWQQDLTNMMNGLMASRDCNFETVRFRRRSPHFRAIVPLQYLDLREDCGPQLFNALQELATGASAAMF